MVDSRIIIMFLPALMLVACNQTDMPEGKARLAAELPSPIATVEGVAPETQGSVHSPQTDRLDDGYPDLSPPKLTPDAERTAKGARNILQSFARAIELGEYWQAWTLLSPADKQKWSRVEFTGIFADLADLVVAIPAGASEGAAGSIYYTANITVTGSDRDGHPVRLEGIAVVRRVNDVDGASPAQLRWHFDTLTLDRTQ